MPEITMPKLSDTMTEGTLLRWHKKKGDKIEVGDILAEVETDKATMEMESFEEGTLADIFVPEGGKVLVGAALALVLKDGEKAGDKPKAAPAPTAPAAAAAEHPTSRPAISSGRPLTPRARAAALRTGGGAASGGNINAGIRVKSSPLARKIADARGVRLDAVKGTGPGGRIIAFDVESAPVGSPAPAAGSSPVAAILPTPIAGMPETRVPLSGMRRVIAERLLASKTQIPHFYLSIEIDAAPMMAFRKEYIAASGGKITFNDIALSAVARAAMQKPKVNSAFAGDAIIEYGSVNLSVAIAVEDGLVTPVIRDAQKLSLKEISAAVKDLATRARDKKLKPEEYAGGTITVSNLGSYGIEQFCAIVNPPQAAILAVGAIVKKPVVNSRDEIEIGHRMSITLSGDHRVVDGAVAAEYMTALRKLLESPALLLL
ncbi:MAG: dihydrolipoamide acetyltransferase family protein [Verrucomicrobia bacterium]|nr:dihydrolipoamide acetyltransferase family protein [Verrucomicrobiota bacterium]